MSFLGLWAKKSGKYVNIHLSEPVLQKGPIRGPSPWSCDAFDTKHSPLGFKIAEDIAKTWKKIQKDHPLICAAHEKLRMVWIEPMKEN